MWLRLVLGIHPFCDPHRAAKELFFRGDRDRNKMRREQDCKHEGQAGDSVKVNGAPGGIGNVGVASQGGDIPGKKTASSLDNPREWRKQTEIMRAKLVFGEAQGGNSRDRFQQRVVQSIRADIKRDFLMPEGINLNSMGVTAVPAEDTRDTASRQSSKASLHPKEIVHAARVPLARRSAKRVHASDSSAAGISDEKELDPLALQVLPPMKYMTPSQKQALWQHVQLQNRINAKQERRHVLAHQESRVPSAAKHAAAMAAFEFCESTPLVSERRTPLAMPLPITMAQPAPNLATAPSAPSSRLTPRGVSKAITLDLSKIRDADSSPVATPKGAQSDRVAAHSTYCSAVVNGPSYDVKLNTTTPSFGSCGEWRPATSGSSALPTPRGQDAARYSATSATSHASDVSTRGFVDSKRPTISAMSAARNAWSARQ